MPHDSDPSRIHFVVPRERFVVHLYFFNISANDLIVINEHISSGGYNIYTLYDCFWRLERITPFIR